MEVARVKNRERGQAVKKEKYAFVAVDFDGTLCKDKFPEIGQPKPLVIEFVKSLAAQGSKIILFTSRENGARRLLDEALAFCKAQGIPVYAVNENPGNPYPERIGLTYKDNRKVYADLYIDDKAVRPDEVEQLMKHSKSVRRRRERRRRAVKALVKYGILIAASLFAFGLVHHVRGGGTPGGEILFLMVPVMWLVIEAVIRDLIKDTIRRIYAEIGGRTHGEATF